MKEYLFPGPVTSPSRNKNFLLFGKLMALSYSTQCLIYNKSTTQLKVYVCISENNQVEGCHKKKKQTHNISKIESGLKMCSLFKYE